MKLIFEFYLINDDGGRNRQQNAISNTKIESVHWNLFADLDEPLCLVHVIWTERQMSKLLLNVKYLLLLSFLPAAEFYNLGHIQGIIRVH